MFDILGTVWGSFWHLLLNILVGINSVVHQPAVSIIIFTIFMRLLTVPLTMRALKSSRNMQQIQPLIKDIQRKYGKDKQKQQEETMKLYAEYGINPAASCFPMLIQLPIFFGLYQALRFTLDAHTGAGAVLDQQMHDLKSFLFNPAWANDAANFSQSFLWVPNLAAADPVHIWPVLSGIFQFIQSRMSMPVRDPSMPMDPQQKMMQNIMQFMPLYIVFISWGFPAGNVIYWAFSSIFGAAQQYFITGFGTLPDFPGLGFLPRKQITTPTPMVPKLQTADGPAIVPKRGGMMNWMMNKTMEAREAQNGASQPETPREDGATPNATRPIGKNGAGQPTTPVEKGRGSVYGSANQSNREVPSSTMKLASDPKYRAGGSVLQGGNAGANGSGADIQGGAAEMPRKKKNKR